jgi:hypothetical protein
MSERTLTHVDRIEGAAHDLLKELERMQAEEHVQELLRIIHNPGWTTPAELSFALTLLGEMTDRVRGIQRLGDQMLAGAREVEVTA